MTNTNYTAQLPLRNYRIVTPVPRPTPPAPAHLQTHRDGFWYCKQCQAESEKPVRNLTGCFCGRCGSSRLTWIKFTVKKEES